MKPQVTTIRFYTKQGMTARPPIVKRDFHTYAGTLREARVAAQECRECYLFTLTEEHPPYHRRYPAEGGHCVD